MPKSTIDLLNDQIDESQHDIESIETYISKQTEASISTEQVDFLRGFQDMYRQRIVSWQAKVSECKLSTAVCVVGPLTL